MKVASGIAYDRQGQGPTVLLLHGTGGSHRIWRPIVERLRADRDVISVDLPGCGSSAPISAPGPVTNAEFARRIGAFIDELGLQHVHVAGTSLGGHVALLLAAAGKADAAVAFSPTGFWNKRQSLYTRTLVRVSRFGTFLSAPVVPALAATVFGRNLLLGTSFANPAGVPSEDAHAVVTDLRTSAGFAGFAQANSERLGGQPVSTSEAASRPDAGLRDALAKVPVTIAWAEQDRFLSPRQAEVARLALPHARHTTLPNCGHLATWDDPALLTELILTADFANHESH